MNAFKPGYECIYTLSSFRRHPDAKMNQIYQSTTDTKIHIYQHFRLTMGYVGILLIFPRVVVEISSRSCSNNYATL